MSSDVIVCVALVALGGLLAFCAAIFATAWFAMRA